MKNNLLYFNIFIALFFIACGNDSEKNSEKIIPKEHVEVVNSMIDRPDFNVDSAYLFIKEQVDFGPRFPNNEAHAKCAIYLENKLKEYGLSTITQIGKTKTFNNKEITIKNIIGAYNPDAKKRILLFAHWDSRPFADQDHKDLTKPILGANDGASGVGVLIEVARQLSIKKPEIGIDIIFFDAEDYGQPSSGMTETDTDTWCLGSQYWGKNLHKKGYTADYGILLDMVGSTDAYFTKESLSMKYAPEIIQKVWSNAKSLGHANYFVDKETFFVGTDDHKYVNELAKIPSIDIIHYDRISGNFHPTWHTHDDNMDVINKSTLRVVGETILYTIYTEK